jgi:hypothetical protein
MKFGGVMFFIAGLLWISGGGSSSFRIFGIDSFLLGTVLFFFNSLLFFALGSDRIRRYLESRE